MGLSITAAYFPNDSDALQYVCTPFHQFANVHCVHNLVLQSEDSYLMGFDIQIPDLGRYKDYFRLRIPDVLQ